ncbi:C2H2 finger domain-containing protein [Parathielavia appendiculata]|uniref:C2H2 finger domain-containing protein n=1 Tax=Parathielavia appendiculata TaxID=2587402 RepID=A0AAN6TS06_9PEZI|nr:C2H2 finger domain-containing protein [Parathielavia appendiculata]
MGHHRRSFENVSDSDFSPSDDGDLFDTDENHGVDSTEATDLDLDNLDPDDSDSDLSGEDFDIDDQVQLYRGNVHPPEYYSRGIKEPAQRDPYSRYAPKTKLRLIEVEEQWGQFCTEVRLGDPRKVFEGTKSSGALNTRWKNLQIVYKVAMRKKFDTHIYNEMQEVLQRLVVKHGLRTTRRRNRFMTVETLKDQIETTLSTTKKSFDLGELRIYAVLFLLLLSPGGSRPESILLLRYGDIRVTLARDPEGGPHNLMIKFTPEFTKTYLGAKESVTFTVPEGIFHRSLLLSPHVFLLALLFRHKAFLAPHLTSPEGIEKLDIYPGENELPIPLRSDLNDIYIFRKAIKTATGYQISLNEGNERITYATMSGWIKAIGEILGIEYTVIAYSLRYGTGNKLDQSPNISDALKNLCLGHANSVPFQRHYLAREICADTYAIVLGERPQQALITQSCGIAHSISKRRPISLTPEQVASISTDPRIRDMKQKLQKMPMSSKERIRALRKIKNAKQRMKNALLRKIREEWTTQQAVDDINRQLRGEGFAPQLTEFPYPPQHPAQKRLVAAITAPAEQTLENQYRRRNKAIHAIIAYCSVEEGRSPCRTSTVATKSTKRLEEPKAGSPLYAAALSVFVRDEKERPRRCFICIGKAMSLAPDDPNVEKLIDEFYTSSDLSKHFRRRHLSNLRDSDEIECQVCCIPLDNKMHLQNHALRIHGTVS